jgi:metallo-beta-lactamase family protein
VKAKIHTIGGFSAHADQAELLAWHAAARAKRTFLVHGEEKSMQTFAGLLKETEVVMPETGARFDL